MSENAVEKTEDDVIEMDTMKVEVKKSCPMYYYNHLRRRPGDVFELLKDRDFSERHMDWVHPDTPLTISTAKSGAQAMIDARNGTDTINRMPVAIGEAKRQKITRPGRKEEVAEPKAKVSANGSKKPKAKSKELSGSKKVKKNLDPNKSKNKE